MKKENKKNPLIWYKQHFIIQTALYIDKIDGTLHSIIAYAVGDTIKKLFLDSQQSLEFFDNVDFIGYNEENNIEKKEIIKKNLYIFIKKFEGLKIVEQVALLVEKNSKIDTI